MVVLKKRFHKIKVAGIHPKKKQFVTPQRNAP